MRGEYAAPKGFCTLFSELPPRARRILPLPVSAVPFLGTTSACAENTLGDGVHGVREWNYLRVRGEYTPVSIEVLDIAELPPRARRIQRGRAGTRGGTGTTSACAENTRMMRWRLATTRNYLRVRGEYFTLAGVMSCK